MKFRGKKILILSYFFSVASSGFSQSKDSPQQKFLKNLSTTKRQYRQNEIDDRKAWQQFAKLYDYALKTGVKTGMSELLQSQAYILQKGKYPLLSAKYAAWAISSNEDPMSKEVLASWQLLDQISNKELIHDILIDLASKLIDKPQTPPVFGNSWNYFLGEAALSKEDTQKAIVFFEKLKVQDRYYMAGRYQLAMTYLFSKENANKAGLILKAMTAPELKSALSLQDPTRLQYIDQAYLALGRVQYERKKFVSSAKYFRKVRRTSPYYYNALFEQAWAFFLAGYPNHALGSLHSVDSPFFPGRFNPETSILRSIIYYWMCRYDDSKTALAEFLETYAEPVNNLDTWLSQKSLSPQKALELFENLINGVSGSSLGIDRNLLESVTKTAPMVFARDRLATVLAESQRLEGRGIFNSKKQTKVPKTVLEGWVKDLSLELGRVYIAELESLRDEYKNLRAQANFIYIELLMSEKEQALGKELHQDEKYNKIDLKKPAKGWGQGDMPWRASDKGEFWWDEVGFFVYQVKPKCNAN